jgi:hypothetical protein
MITKMLFIAISLTILTSCATYEGCHEIGDTIERTKCYENEKWRDYYNDTGWRYKHDY